MFLEFVADSDESKPLSKVIRSQAGLSLTFWRKVKRTGKILCNNNIVPLDYTVKTGDRIRLEWHEESHLPSTPLPLSILFEDDCFLIIDKPPFQLVHPTTALETDTLANAVLYYYEQTKQNCNYHPIYRLDRNTSGLVMIAKNPLWQQAFSHHEHLERTYWAFIAGSLPEREGSINLRIGRKPGSIIERMVSPCGQDAITLYKTLLNNSGLSLLQVRLKTGRTHQIRVHLSALGHPLLGDDLYQGSCQLIQRQALHAQRLSFTHPKTKKTVIIEAPLPKDLKNLLQIITAPR